MHPIKESNSVEFKESWKDDYLKQVCSLANARGGILYVGLADDGSVVGIENAAQLLEEIPNKITNILGIVPDVVLMTENDKLYLQVCISQSSQPLSYRGRFYVRSGTTTQELNGTSLVTTVQSHDVT